MQCMYLGTSDKDGNMGMWFCDVYTAEKVITLL